MKRFYIPFLFVLSGLNPIVFADTLIESKKGLYVTGSTGWSSTSDNDWEEGSLSGSIELDPGLAFEFGFGYDFGNSLRTEITYKKTNAEIDKFNATDGSTSIVATASDWQADTTSFMANAYKDFQKKDNKFVPYIGAGLGFTNFEIGDVMVSGTKVAGADETVIGYQAKVGLTYLASDKSDVFVEASYLGSADPTLDGTKFDGLSIWGVSVGGRYKF